MSANPEPIKEFAGRMKTDWNERARENAEYFIASTEFSSEEQFCASGQRDVGILFQGLEHLIHAEQKVLDLGCGIGRMDQVLAPIVRSIVGVDVSSEMVTRANERLRRFPNARFVEVSGCDLAPIPDNSISLLFSHIVFQHIPKSVVLAYITDAYRILAPGGHLVFQVPERLADSPPDPAADDTFGMRYYIEDEIRYLMDLMEYTDVSFARLAATEAESVNHLRVTARTKSVIEKIEDIDNPTDSELEEWAYTWCPAAPEGWLNKIAQPQHTELFLKFAADPACPQRDWFLSELYALAAQVLSSEEPGSPHVKNLLSLVDRARNHHGHKWVAMWADAVDSAIKSSQEDFVQWANGQRAFQEVIGHLNADGHPLADRLQNMIESLAKRHNVEIGPIDLDAVVLSLCGASSPTIVATRLQSKAPESTAAILASNIWFSWRRSIEEAS
ncbi:MAG: SAM-dependent methyltransferase [Planctomycetota bacterium]|jgi:SAM-dependent methyltransferase